VALYVNQKNKGVAILRELVERGKSSAFIHWGNSKWMNQALLTGFLFSSFIRA